MSVRVIVPPLVVDNRGDVFVFDSIIDLEQYLEPIDVENNEYVVYDSEGRIVDLGIRRRKTFFSNAAVVAVQGAEFQPTRAAELRNKLVELLGRLGRPALSAQALQVMSLQELVQRARDVVPA